jgi:hypothetical protein
LFSPSAFKGAVSNFLLAYKPFGWLEGKYLMNIKGNDSFFVSKESIIILFNKSLARDKDE